jgi:hypothetical protein
LLRKDSIAFPWTSQLTALSPTRPLAEEKAWCSLAFTDTFQGATPSKAMKPTPESIALFAEKIAELEDKLQKLDWEIAEIGQPAAFDLKRRLDALKIEENALKRNLSEALGMEEPKEVRMSKIESLLAHIEREEKSVERGVAFLNQSGHTSSEFAAQAGKRLVELCLRALNRVLGEHRPLGSSVFVNHSHETLAHQYGLADEPPNRPDGGR